MDTSSVEDLSTLVVDFLNTIDVEVHADLLDGPVGWAAWARERRLVDGDRELARTVRGALRDVLAGIPADLPAVPLTVSAQRGAVRLVGLEPRDATATVLAAVATIAAREGLDRFKLCSADDCRWAFHDRSKNHSRTWCDMAVCGNRAKSRTYRARID